MNSNKLTDGQTSYLRRAVTEGNGLIEIGELAKSLGKRKGNLIRKLEDSFSKDALLKMRSGYLQRGGKGATREVSTYMLPPKVAGALAMSYDLQLGVTVLTILEEAINAVNKADAALKAGDHEAAQKALSTFREQRVAYLQYKPDGTEAADRRTALARIGRRTQAEGIQS
ncbi:hypothetical protein JKX24_01310 [Serratia proteamaculans]|uniref:Uncharacterized protein n=1 Tax=Serratia proteamaculans TaxID=28151 RepID=A0A7U0N708_SERPR|nr:MULTISPECIES: hypothetical protein [Serratia]MBO1502643.1 hypothetical protein [Serratia proteamaculans]QQX53699.1 hypothetical protein JKX24_01310 [Serratia proteamaculans]CAI1596533.1 Uncharacterised protein [Serratia marcescens]